MTDTVLLDAAIAAKGLKYSFLASALGLSNYGFYKKRYGLTEFTASEVARLSQILGLSRDERDKIFLM
ncbi:MAG: hypothetical protein UDG94_00710 [Peptococcaceae bacterium]|nr:hypothetical protein [Peptococcaceae bacterium]